MISPGRATVMGDGWETRRRRDSGHDWVLLRLAGAGDISAAALQGCDAGESGLDAAEWFDLLPMTVLQPDPRHRLRTGPARSRLASHVRLEIHPDGGMARLRLFGELTGDGRARLGLAWFDRLPARHAAAGLGGE